MLENTMVKLNKVGAIDKNTRLLETSTTNTTNTIDSMFVNDKDVWAQCPVDYLWVYDKLILARKLGYQAAPAGIPVPQPDWYIVRPITNIRMMSRGAQKQWLTPDDTDKVPDGYFWTQWFEGRHTSVDFHWGKQHLAVEGFRNRADRLDRFSCWKKITDIVPFPSVLQNLGEITEWVNVEYVGDHIIEIHLRYNDDFRNHSGNTIYPVWCDESYPQPSGTCWYHSPSGDRLGFWVQE